MYQALRPSRSEFVPVRNLRYHVRLWGEPTPARPPLVLLHGWMDVAASWQFVVDALAEERLVVAPDWRGFGLTDGGGVDNYWMPDYLADLDWLLDHYAGDDAGRPGRPQHGRQRRDAVRRRAAAARAPAGQPRRLRHARLRARAGAGALRPSGSTSSSACTAARWRWPATPAADGVARRLMKTNPRLSPGQGRLAGRATGPRPRPQADGGERWEILGDPAHKIINANLFRVDEMLALYAAIARAGAGGGGLATTASANGGRAATRWPNTTSA